LSNFAQLLDDGVFWLSLPHTFVFAAVSVVLEVVLALGIDAERVWISPVTRALILQCAVRRSEPDAVRDRRESTTS
jgi:ABC-type sugar transport system permease subunit